VEEIAHAGRRVVHCAASQKTPLFQQYERKQWLHLDQLTDVRFSGTRAGAEGSAHIASTLSELAACGRLNHITRLDLADNSFGAWYQDLANALKQCSKLQYLDFHDCCLGDDGIVMVCNALLESKASLTFLSLSGNNIGAENAEGSKIIANLIKSLNGTLIEFHASENEMKSPGIRRIARALQESDIVTEIILNENECGTIGADALIAMAGRVPNLKKIELNSNYFLEDVVDRLTPNSIR
jgi:Ran GTPase-activating protein (RanGAP) involved in mRNA processing and transport